MAKNAVPLDRLYMAVPAEFVRTRNAVAKGLARAGHSREATEVKRLRRPTIPAGPLVAVWINRPRGPSPLQTHGPLCRLRLPTQAPSPSLSAIVAPWGARDVDESPDEALEG